MADAQSPKLIAGFLFGAVLMAGVIHTAGAGVVFVGGVAAGILPLLIAASSPSRLRAWARLLGQFADRWEEYKSPPSSGKNCSSRAIHSLNMPVSGRNNNPWGYVKPSSKQRDQVLHDSIAEYLGDEFDAPKERRGTA